MGRRTVLAVVVVASCGGEADRPGPGPDPEPLSCAIGERLVDDTCVPPGVPAEACNEGFAPADDGGCLAVVPADPCAPGEMAVPGDTTCRSIAPCGEAPWGDIPTDGTTQHVDADFVGTSDGGATAPWTTIQTAVDAAAPGAIVAVAAGSYPETVTISGKAVRLWGRCPSLVEVTGSLSGVAGVQLFQADGAEVHGLALTSTQLGVSVFGTGRVTLSQLWVHDTSERGVYLEDMGGAPEARLEQSLVERSTLAGAYTAGSILEIEGSEVRDVIAAPISAGIIAEINSATGGRAQLAVAGSHVHGVQAAGVSANGSSAVVERTYLHDLGTDPELGFAVLGDAFPALGQASEVTLRRCVIDRPGAGGLRVDAGTALVELTTFRDAGDVHAQTSAINAQPDETMGPSAVTIRQTTMVRSHRTGFILIGSNADIDGLHVAETMSTSSGIFGRGLQAQPWMGTPSNLSVRHSRISRSHDHAVAVVDSSAILDDVVLSETQPLSSGIMGDGLSVVSDTAPASATITNSATVGNARSGIASFGAATAVGGMLIDCNQIDLASQDFGSYPASFENLGDNRCGCGDEERTCALSATELQPPSAPE
jgi:hypothetical protein